MKKVITLLLASATILISCNDMVKKTEAQVVVEAGTDISDKTPKNKLTGYYVGFFRDTKISDEDYVYEDPETGYYDESQNKINISIDVINKDNTVKGHTIVAGNERPFMGTFTKSNDTYSFTVKEPGTNKYDGVFTFTIDTKNQLLGTWKAFNSDIKIPNRKYKLEKKNFIYNSGVMLDKHKLFVNWGKTETVRDTFKYDTQMEGNEDMPDYEVYESEKYAVATEKIYEINASTTLLQPSDVENLHQTDLIILRNTIYARHGYSFKDKHMRLFFDAQEWYIPMYADIRDAITATEKENIELLLRYEKNASEYYLSFGR